MRRLAGADDWFHTEYTSGRWEPDTHDILKQHLPPGSLFIDVGAWIGPVTRWALDMHANVHAYEPDPIAYAALRINCPGAVTMPNAVSTHRYVYMHDVKGDSNTRTDQTPSDRAVRAITPTETLRGVTPALIKIDVEGAETDILPAYLHVAQCPIWVAWHEDYWPAGTTWDFTGWAVDGHVGGWGHSLLTRHADV